MQILGENLSDLARFSSISWPHLFLRVRHVPVCASCVCCSSCRGARVLEGEPQGQSRALWPSSRGCRAGLVRQSGHREYQSRPALGARARSLPFCASISLSLRSGSAPLQQSCVSPVHTLVGVAERFHTHSVVQLDTGALLHMGSVLCLSSSVLLALV